MNARKLQDDDALHQLHSQRGASLAELSQRWPLLVVFLRHMGCTFCREALGDLAVRRAELEALGLRIAVVHMGQPLAATLLLQKYGLEDLHRYSDPQCAMYRAFELKRGTPAQLLGPKVWWRAIPALLAGHGFGPIAGDGFRMPGVFVLDAGQITAAFRHTSAADRPDYVTIAKNGIDASSPGLLATPAFLN